MSDDDSSDDGIGSPFQGLGFGGGRSESAELDDEDSSLGGGISRGIREASETARRRLDRERSESVQIGMGAGVVVKPKRVPTPARKKVAAVESESDDDSDEDEDEEDIPVLSPRKKRAPASTTKTTTTTIRSAAAAGATRGLRPAQITKAASGGVSLIKAESRDEVPPALGRTSSGSSPLAGTVTSATSTTSDDDAATSEQNNNNSNRNIPFTSLGFRKAGPARRPTRVVNVAGTSQRAMLAMASTSRTSSAASDAVRRTRGRALRGDDADERGSFLREDSVVSHDFAVDSPLLTPTQANLPLLQVPKTRRSAGGQQQQQQQQTDGGQSQSPNQTTAAAAMVTATTNPSSASSSSSGRIRQRNRVVSIQSSQTHTPPTTSSPARYREVSASAGGSKAQMVGRSGLSGLNANVGANTTRDVDSSDDDDEETMIDWADLAEGAQDSDSSSAGGGQTPPPALLVGKGKGRGLLRQDFQHSQQQQLPTPATTQPSQSVRVSRGNLLLQHHQQQLGRVSSFGSGVDDGEDDEEEVEGNGEEDEDDDTVVVTKPREGNASTHDTTNPTAMSTTPTNTPPSHKRPPLRRPNDEEESGSVRKSSVVLGSGSGSASIMDILPGDYACRRTLFDGVVPPAAREEAEVGALAVGGAVDGGGLTNAAAAGGNLRRKPRKSVGFSSSPPRMFDAPELHNMLSSSPAGGGGTLTQQSQQQQQQFPKLLPPPQTPERGKQRLKSLLLGAEFQDLFAPKIKYREWERRAIQERATPELLRVRAASVVMQQAIFGGTPGSAEKEAVLGVFGGFLRGGVMGDDAEGSVAKGKGVVSGGSGDDGGVASSSKGSGSPQSTEISYPALPSLVEELQRSTSLSPAPSAASAAGGASPNTPKQLPQAMFSSRLLGGAAGGASSPARQTPVREKDLRATLLATLTRSRKLLGVRTSVTPPPAGDTTTAATNSTPAAAAATPSSETPQPQRRSKRLSGARVEESFWGKDGASAAGRKTPVKSSPPSQKQAQARTLKLDTMVDEGSREESLTGKMIQAQLDQQQKEYSEQRG
ncbi:hypothetical protein DFH27DRAFT_107870 [Peziza echinospora]|nr:hypothetical protein DFH27DRAFT_107870 [Peziza echinospora]